MEAGPHFDPANHDQQTQLKWAYESPDEVQVPNVYLAIMTWPYGGWDLEGEPYTKAEGTEFSSTVRACWAEEPTAGRISTPFWAAGFKSKSRNDVGEDWPIGYNDVKPYYDKVDKLIGVFGSKENIYNEPDGFLASTQTAFARTLYYKKEQKKQELK